MAQHDHDIANASGAAVRADMNLLFAAIASNNSGATAPPTTFANQWWFDTANNLLMQRDEANTAWITVALKDATNWKTYFGTVQLDAADLVWTGDHDFGAQVLFSGVISPAQITANQNNFNPAGLSGALHLRLNTDASRNITGLAGGATGRLILITNIGSTDIVLTNQDALSTAANRFLFADGDVTVTADAAILIRYDGTSLRWRSAHQIGVAGGATLVNKTADETVNNSTTFQDDDHLFFAMAANTTYLVDAILLLDAANATPNYKFQWTFPTSCTLFWQTIASSAWIGGGVLLLTETGIEVANTSIGIQGIIYRAIVRNAANAGNLQLQWAQDVANASNSKVLQHSSLVIRNLGAT